MKESTLRFIFFLNGAQCILLGELLWTHNTGYVLGLIGSVAIGLFITVVMENV